MPSVDSDYCGDEISEYNCSEGSYEYGDGTHEYGNESYEGYDGLYEQDNGAHEHDGESYEGYDGTRDNGRNGDENYYSRDECRMNGAYGSYDDVEGVEEPYGDYYSEDEGSQTSHHGYEGDVRYNAFSHMSYEPFEEDCDRNGSGEVEAPSLSCATFYSHQ